VIERLVVWYRRFSTIAEMLMYVVPCGLIAIFALSMFSEVVLRTFFAHSLAALQEFPRLLMGYCVFLLLGVLFRRNRHIRVDFVVERLKGRARRVLTLFINVVMVGGSAMLLRGALSIIKVEFVTGHVSPTEIIIPMWIAYASLVIGVASLLLWSIEAVVRNVAGLISSSRYAGQENNKIC